MDEVNRTAIATSRKRCDKELKDREFMVILILLDWRDWQVWEYRLPPFDLLNLSRFEIERCEVFRIRCCLKILLRDV